ncbi:PA-phosphatase related phosphoesterase family protein [Abortiporus biennis]
MSYHPIHDPEPHSSYPPTAAPRRTTMDPKRRMKLILAYTPDWCITIGLAGVFFALDKVPGFKREFSLQDTSIRHTFAVQERVPAWALYLIAIVAPLVLQPLINLISVRSWWDLHASTLGLILSLSLTGAITQFSKITVGRPRPDLIDRCQPIASAADAAVGLSTVHICTQIDQSILRDGWRSFPSGHSSLSFAGLGFLSFYLAGKVHLFDRRGHARKAWLAFAPLSGAALVAISRTMDYRHHWQDVLVGSLLGLSIAYFTYRQYYPSLASPQCEKPHSPPYKEDGESLLPIHQRPPSPRNIPLRDDRDTG